MIKMHIGLQVKYPLFLYHCNENLKFLHSFSKNTQISNFMKIRSVGAVLFHSDGRTDGHEGNIRFSQFFERA